MKVNRKGKRVAALVARVGKSKADRAIKAVEAGAVLPVPVVRQKDSLGAALGLPDLSQPWVGRPVWEPLVELSKEDSFRG